ncbi:hypothetical protein DFH06DRAFT_1351026 [Mycena polygramma]|nr:hypothetical protein DFH06DRAFT_1351026 [Mycena polygramma]
MATSGAPSDSAEQESQPSQRTVPSPPPRDTTPPPRNTPPPGDDTPPPPRNDTPSPSPPRDNTPHPETPVLVTFVPEKAPRHKKGDPKRPTGKLPWVWGTKLVFFENRKEEWLRESESNQTGTFLTKVSKLYVRKYGWHIADNQDLAVDVEDPPDSAADEVVHQILSEEEAALRAGHMKKLRGRIGQWYRTTYGGIKTDKTAFSKLFTGALDGAPPKPQRGRIEHFYSRKFYADRVKPRVEARLAALKRRAGRTQEDAPEAIDIVAKTTAEVWEEETPAFKKECEVAMEREYQMALKGWEASLADSPTKTPEEIAATLANAAYYLQPFVDAIQERFGMCASVLLCGPIGIRGGRIRLQSVHAGKTKGLAPVNWPQFDWQGYSDMERSMIAFGRECFSDAECRARVRRGRDSKLWPQDWSRWGEVVSAAAAPAPALTLRARGTGATAGAGMSSTPGSGVQMGIVQNPGRRRPEAARVGGGDGGGGQGTRQDGAPGGGDSKGNGGEGDPIIEEDGQYDHLWQRGDRAQWSEDLAQAHATFERGKR